ncbi:hypothetical protein LCGC14_1791780 [marine sediment metagenome]|uniref:Uncharacterized protein n=1 Tax=marine sediment metagenome TaxID=412755 RepID=A0A0F9HEW9_9ZZZZ
MSTSLGAALEVEMVMVNPHNNPNPVTPEEREWVARGRRTFVARLAEVLNDSGAQWERGMLHYLEEPAGPIRRDIASLSRRILGREPTRALEMERVAQEISKAPVEAARKMRQDLAAVARSLGIEVRREL